MFARKFEEFALQDRVKIGMTTIDKIPDKSSGDSTEETPSSARSSSSSSEVSADSGLASPFSSSFDVSPQAAKIFALAKTLEFARSAQVLGMLRAATARAESDLAEEERMRDEMSLDESNDESGVGSEVVMKSDGAASDISDEDVIIGETDEVDMAQTGKKLVSKRGLGTNHARRTLEPIELFLTAALSARLAGEPPTPGPDLVDLHRGLQLPDREVEGSGGAVVPTESEDREDPQPKEEGQDVADGAAHSQGCLISHTIPYHFFHIFTLGSIWPRLHVSPRDPGKGAVGGIQKLSKELFASPKFLGQFLRSEDCTIPKGPEEKRGTLSLYTLVMWLCRFAT